MQDKDVYDRQKTKWNILNQAPNANQGETIKKYPKLTLEDKDAYYFRRKVNSEAAKQAQVPPMPAPPKPQEKKIAGTVMYGENKGKQEV